MAMFGIGLFMALQPKIIACGKSLATFEMVVRFLIGPAVVAACSIAVGLRGVLLRVSIFQAALPLAIVPFVFAKEYNVHAEIITTSHFSNAGCLACNDTVLYSSRTLVSGKLRAFGRYINCTVRTPKSLWAPSLLWAPKGSIHSCLDWLPL